MGSLVICFCLFTGPKGLCLCCGAPHLCCSALWTRNAICLIMYRIMNILYAHIEVSKVKTNAKRALTHKQLAVYKYKQPALWPLEQHRGPPCTSEWRSSTRGQTNAEKTRALRPQSKALSPAATAPESGATSNGSNLRGASPQWGAPHVGVGAPYTWGAPKRVGKKGMGQSRIAQAQCSTARA